MTDDVSVQIAVASPEQQRALAHVATRERAHDETWETRRFPPWPNPGRAISRIDIAAGCGNFPPCKALKAHGAPAEGEKIWRWTLWVWNPCNPLKSHKTAKGIFGNPWTKTA
jgi:hypothetical protein